MSTYKLSFSERMRMLRNFMATSLGKAENSIDKKSDTILVHLVKLLIYSDSIHRHHWTKKIMTQIKYISNHRKLKSPLKILSAGNIRSLIIKNRFEDEDDVYYLLQDAISDELKIAKNKISLDVYNFEEIYISLTSLLDQIENYFNGLMDFNELWLRIEYSFLWNKNMSDDTIEELMNRWKFYK